MYDDLRKGSRNQGASAQEVTGYCTQFVEALEYKSCVDYEVFDLVDREKVTPRNYITGRWVLTLKTDKQGNFLKAKARWVLRSFQDKQGISTDRFSCFHKTWVSDELPNGMAASKNWNIFHIDLKTAFLQRQSDSMIRDVVCQLPPEASHPPHIAARLKKPAYGMNDAPRRWWNVLDKKLCNCQAKCDIVLIKTQGLRNVHAVY